jgi:hypothetical protein
MADRNYLTIVSGLPRSGTSMMMKMISEGGIPALIDNIREADEDNPKGYYEYEPVKKTKEDSSWVPGGMGKVVKMVHLLLLDLPLEYEYRVVFMRRNLDEVVASQNVMLDRHGKKTDDMPKERLQAFYRTQIRKVEDYMQEHAEHFKFIEIDYNEIMQNPAPHVQRLNEFLGDMDTETMMTVIDPSLYRQRAK